MAQPNYRSLHMGSDPVHGSEGAIEQGGFDNPSHKPDLTNKHTNLNPQIVGWHDLEGRENFRTNPDDDPNSPKGQGGSAASNSALFPLT